MNIFLFPLVPDRIDVDDLEPRTPRWKCRRLQHEHFLFWKHFHQFSERYRYSLDRLSNSSNLDLFGWS